MTTFTNNSIFTKEGKVAVDIYKMQVMTIGMSKLVVGDEKSPIRCDVVLHQEDGHFDDYCFIYHMSHVLSDVMKYNEEIERVKRMMDSNAKFNVYQNPVEFIENCARCLENAPTNRYTKTAFSCTSVESMRYLVHLVADSDANFISEAHAMVARFIDNLKGIAFLQSIAAKLEFKIPDVTAYQRDLLVGDRFRDFMAGLKGYIFKESQDEAKEKIKEMSPVFNNAKSFPFCINESKDNTCDAVYANSDNEIVIAHLHSRRVGASKAMKIGDFINYVVNKDNHGKYISCRDTMVIIVKHFLEHQEFEPKESQLKHYYQFMDWIKNVSVIGKRFIKITSLMNLIDTYNEAENAAIVLTKRGEGLKSNYKDGYKYIEYAVEDEFNITDIIPTINTEKAFAVFIDSNLGQTVKPILLDLMKRLNKHESINIGWRKPKVFIETATHFWINMFSYYYLGADTE